MAAQSLPPHCPFCPGYSHYTTNSHNKQRSIHNHRAVDLSAIQRIIVKALTLLESLASKCTVQPRKVCRQTLR